MMHLVAELWSLVPVWCVQKGEQTELKPSDTIQIVNVPQLSTVDCKSGLRKDTGEYIITVTNKHGSDTATINVVVLGKCKEIPFL